MRKRGCGCLGSKAGAASGAEGLGAQDVRARTESAADAAAESSETRGR